MSQSQPDYRVLFESAPGKFLVLRPDLTIAAASDEYLSATHTRRADITGRHLFDVFPDNPDDPRASGVDNLRASLERVRSTLAADTMPVQKYDIRRPTADGGGYEERFWSPKNSPVLGSDGALAYIVHHVEDVTEIVRLQRVETDLHRRFLDSIVEAIPNMVFVKDAETLRFVRFNRAGEQLLGLKREELIGRSDWDLFPTEEAEAFVAKDREVLAGREILEIPEEPIHTRDRGLRYLRTRKVPILDDAGWPVYLLGISEDITDERAAGEALAHAVEAAEAANRSKSEFLARMSHELRTPLNSIIGFSEVLADGTFGSLNDRQRRYVGNVLTSGRQLLDLINDILDLSKVEAGRMELIAGEMSVASVVAEVQAQLAPMADRKMLELTAEVPADLPVLIADGSRVRQMLYNLVSNAIKYTREGGDVRIEARHIAGVPGMPAGWIELAVSDNGIGIPIEDQQRVFGEFEQVSSDYVRQQQGTGLGLPLVQRLAELHGGGVSMESTPGVGSTFRLTLPVAGPGNGAPPAVVRASEQQGPLVLIVEDEPTAADLLRHYLEASGCRVAMATTGDGAMEMARTLLPSAITLDIQLPDRDGLAVLARLKTDSVTRRIPVIVVSITEDRAVGFKLGAAEWFVKPVNGEVLLDAVRRVIAATSVQGATA